MPRLTRICLLMLFSLPPLARALDPNRQISQYAHTAWRIQDGAFSGTPNVITQTNDGYLWLGMNTGLARFDGVRFLPWLPSDGERLLDTRIFALLAARDGSLWIGTGNGLAHWKDGHLVNYPNPQGRIYSILENDDGTVWIVRTQVPDATGPLCHVTEKGSRCYGTADGIPILTAMHLLRDNAGNLWLGGYDGLCRWKPGSSTTYFQATVQPMGKRLVGVEALAYGLDGVLWAGIERYSAGRQLQQFTGGSWTSYVIPGLRGTNVSVAALFADRDHTTWIGASSHGIYRVNGARIDHFGSEDGLTSNGVASFYQDREGTLWVATSKGVDAFHDLPVVSYSTREGLSGDSASTVVAARDGTVWIGNSKALDFIHPDNRFPGQDKLSAIREGKGFPGRDVTTMLEDHTGKLWLGIDVGLWTYEHGRFREVKQPDGTPIGITFSIVEDTDHNIWVRAGPKLLRIQDMQVRQEFDWQKISTSYILASDPTGGIWIGFVNGDIARYRNGRWETFPPAPGTDHQIRDFLIDADGAAWASSLLELARIKNGQRRVLTTRNGLPCDGIYGLVKDNLGNLWLSTRCGFVVIAQAELEKWWNHPQSVLKMQRLDSFDGVQPGLTSLKPQSSRAPDGRLWFVNASILQMVDPNHPVRNLIPPPVHVMQIIADRKTYLPQDNISLPALTRDLEIDYAGLSFVVPQKVRYRYKLEGHDRVWQEPGTRRQAFYSDLSPGKYRFLVVACNNDGVWNENGASLGFRVLPMWYQTNSFRALAAICLAVAAWALYRLRVRQIATAISTRFDERLAERTRLARDLHDTLLQTIQGSKMVADDALDESPDAARMHRALEKLSHWLDQAMQEGRAALNSLRASTTHRNDLAEAFQNAIEDCLVPGSMEVAFTVNGTVSDTHPIVRDELYRIGYEAIRNASAHSKGTRLEVEMTYGQHFVLRVRDNGRGISPAILNAGKTGHFGLKGMQERAARIGGKIAIASSPNAGTEIRLQVPGKIVFRKIGPARQTFFERIKRYFRPAGNASRLD